MGILIFEGMRCGILDGDLTISIDENGSLSTNAVLSTSYNTLPIWLNLAQKCCEEAKLANEKIVHSWPSDEVKQKQMLLAELRPSMLSIVSCAISIDALYDMMKPLAKLDAATIKGWQKRKRARAFQMAEVFRRTFRLETEEVKRCVKIIKEISNLRDGAVHPSQKLENAMQRADVPVGVDWRFAAYHYENSRVALDNTMKMFIEFMKRAEWDEKILGEMEILKKALIENGVIQQG